MFFDINIFYMDTYVSADSYVFYLTISGDKHFTNI